MSTNQPSSSNCQCPPMTATSTAQAFNPLAGMSILLIRAYQMTRFLRQPSCRFYPSCSQYMAVSMQRFGFFRGLLAGSMRILRCHPFHPGGVDEVPEQFSELNIFPARRVFRTRGNG